MLIMLSSIASSPLPGTVKKLKAEMGEHIGLAEMGELGWILGVDICKDLKAHTISLSQSAYITQILEKFGMANCKNATTPLEPHINLTPGSEHVSTALLLPKKPEYCKLVGLLMYLGVMTRTNLASALTTSNSLTPLTWKLVSMSFGTSSVISWSSKKQPIITLPSTESKYVVLTHPAKEAKWLQTLAHRILPVVGLGSHIKKFNPTVLYCNTGNPEGAIKLSTNPVFHARTKHIDIHFHFICQTITSQDLQLVYCPTNAMVAYIMTKQLVHIKFTQFRKMMGVLGPDKSIDSDACIEGEC
ncbi:hypothetical protein H1R20_g4442, partial [Candolleomyces eurysporus]